MHRACARRSPPTSGRATGATSIRTREITVASGATEAIFDAIQAFIGPGDEIVVFEPFYDSYPTATHMAGGTFRPVALRPPDWSFDLGRAARRVHSTHAGASCSTRRTTRPARSSRRAETASSSPRLPGTRPPGVTDEVYDRILYRRRGPHPVATLPGMWERTLTINSTGKTFSMTGWKIGYAIGPAPLNAALRAVHQFVTFATATPFQEAMAVAIEQAAERDYYRELAAEYDERREALDDAL